jgi:hypothetical protein
MSEFDKESSLSHKGGRGFSPYVHVYCPPKTNWTKKTLIYFLKSTRLLIWPTFFVFLAHLSLLHSKRRLRWLLDHQIFKFLTTINQNFIPVDFTASAFFLVANQGVNIKWIPFTKQRLINFQLFKDRVSHFPPGQGCQMAYFQTKNPNLGKFWRLLQWKMGVIWSILWPFGLFYGRLVYFMDIWYIFVKIYA